MREITDRDRKVCGQKHHYATENAANAASKRIANRYGKAESRPYICPVCGDWCLASQSGVPKRTKKGVIRHVVKKTHKNVRPYKPPPLD